MYLYGFKYTYSIIVAVSTSLMRAYIMLTVVRITLDLLNNVLRESRATLQSTGENVHALI